VHRAPRSFELDAEGRARVVEPPGDSLQAILDAEASCPSFAIEVEAPEASDS